MKSSKSLETLVTAYKEMIEIASKINNLDNVEKNIENFEKRIEEQEKEIEEQKKEIEELERQIEFQNEEILKKQVDINLLLKENLKHKCSCPSSSKSLGCKEISREEKNMCAIN